jgi:hypothetical protein
VLALREEKQKAVLLAEQRGF